MGGGAREGAQHPGEGRFLDSIDCLFPYSDRARALALAEEAATISPNALFAVVYEVCHVPRGVSADPETCHAVLARVGRLLAHPLGKVILPLARSVVDGKRPSVQEQIDAMREVSPFPGQYSALQVAYLAGDPAEPLDDELDRVYDEIVESWRKRKRGG